MKRVCLLVVMAGCSDATESKPAPPPPVAAPAAPAPPAAPAKIGQPQAAGAETTAALTDEQRARQAAIEAARQAGALGSTAIPQGGSFAGLDGVDPIPSGFEGDDSAGRLDKGDKDKVHPRGIRPHLGQLTCTGGDLEPAIIRRYIEGHLLKVANCYENELISDPTLAGTVTAKFTIRADGNVEIGGSADGVHRDVSSCIAKVINHAIKYPKPKDGAAVNCTCSIDLRPPRSP